MASAARCRLLPAAAQHRSYSDPHVLYDSLHGRWIATEVSWDCTCDRRSSSDTVPRLRGVGDGRSDRHMECRFIPFPDQLPDYPAPGTSTDKVGIASNLYTAWRLPAREIASQRHLHRLARLHGLDDILNVGSFALDRASSRVRRCSPIGRDPGPGHERHALPGRRLDNGVPGELNIVLFTVIGSVVANTFDFGAVFDLTPTGFFPRARSTSAHPTRGGHDRLRAGLADHRRLWQGNRLVFVSTFPCGTGPRDCVRVSELNTAGVTVSSSIRR